MGARGAHSTEVCVDSIGKRMSQSWENQRAVNCEREARGKRELGALLTKTFFVLQKHARPLPLPLLTEEKTQGSEKPGVLPRPK